MDRNSAARSQIRVTMAEGAGAVDSDPLTDIVIDLVLEAMGLDPLGTGVARVGPGPFDRAGSTRLLAVSRAAPVVDRLEVLTAVASAAERYRRAVNKGKGRKKARRKLFEAVEAWREVAAAGR